MTQISNGMKILFKICLAAKGQDLRRTTEMNARNLIISQTLRFLKRFSDFFMNLTSMHRWNGEMPFARLFSSATSIWATFYLRDISIARRSNCANCATFQLRDISIARHFNCAISQLREMSFARHPICATFQLRDIPSARQPICATFFLMFRPPFR